VIKATREIRAKQVLPARLVQLAPLDLRDQRVIKGILVPLVLRVYRG
jgi:hypothetical protein